MKKVECIEKFIKNYIIFTPVIIVFIYLFFYFIHLSDNKYRLIYAAVCALIVMAVLFLEVLKVKALYQHFRQYRETELKLSLFALQSQMNEHFLHNTIGMISLEAQLQNNNKITKMCSRLSKMLSFSASIGDSFCTLEEEILHAENYLYLMKARYEDYFEYQIEVQDGLKQLKIPKFILQPICENAFLHAFKEKEPVWRLHIHCYREENQWMIDISDNGVGLNADTLLEINRMKDLITMNTMLEQMKSLSFGGLSFPNVYIRLFIAYGDKAVFEVNNTNGGTRIILGGNISEQ